MKQLSDLTDQELRELLKEPLTASSDADDRIKHFEKLLDDTTRLSLKEYLVIQ